MTLKQAKDIISNEIANINDEELSLAWEIIQELLGENNDKC